MKIVISGSSSGIGLAVARALLTEGHAVWGLARSDQSHLSKEFPALFRSSFCDISDFDKVNLAAQNITAEWNNIDALITCAGLQGEIGKTLKSDPLNWEKTIKANLVGTYNCLRSFNELLARTNRRAKIICFSGGGATQTRANFSAYACAKTGIVRLVETIASEEKGRALDINAIAPGAINTRLTDEVISLGEEIVGKTEYEAALKQKKEGGQSIAKAVDLITWLLSEASDGITGKLLSAQWDDYKNLKTNHQFLDNPNFYTLRRITS